MTFITCEVIDPCVETPFLRFLNIGNLFPLVFLAELNIAHSVALHLLLLILEKTLGAILCLEDYVFVNDWFEHLNISLSCFLVWVQEDML